MRQTHITKHPAFGLEDQKGEPRESEDSGDITEREELGKATQ